jgi:hypothetical protein
MGYMTEERRMIQEQARKFAMTEVLPIARSTAAWDWAISNTA